MLKKKHPHHHSSAEITRDTVLCVLRFLCSTLFSPCQLCLRSTVCRMDASLRSGTCGQTTWNERCLLSESLLNDILTSPW